MSLITLCTGPCSAPGQRAASPWGRDFLRTLPSNIFRGRGCKERITPLPGELEEQAAPQKNLPVAPPFSLKRYCAVPCLILLLLAGCSGRQLTSAPEVALALDGPPLAVVGEYGGEAFRGEMERTCMVGVGKISIRGTSAESGLACVAVLDEEPTEKARIRGALSCEDGRVLFFTLRNIGPDQGVGIAREGEGTELAVLFYHSCAEEAERRLPGAAADIKEISKVRNTLPAQTLD